MLKVPDFHPCESFEPCKWAEIVFSEYRPRQDEVGVIRSDEYKPEKSGKNQGT